MAEYRLESAVYAINRAAAEIARRAADEFTERNPEKPRFVAGSIGPTSRTASLSPDVNDPGFRAVTFDRAGRLLPRADRGTVRRRRRHPVARNDVRHAEPQGVPVRASRSSSTTAASTLPVMISATITDASGRTLSGQTVEAFWNSVAHFPALSVGLNCASAPTGCGPTSRSCRGSPPAL